MIYDDIHIPEEFLKCTFAPFRIIYRTMSVWPLKLWMRWSIVRRSNNRKVYNEWNLLTSITIENRKNLPVSKCHRSFIFCLNFFISGLTQYGTIRYILSSHFHQKNSAIHFLLSSHTFFLTRCMQNAVGWDRNHSAYWDLYYTSRSNILRCLFLHVELPDGAQCCH